MPPNTGFEELLDETLAFLRVERAGDTLIAKTPEWFGEYLFGGFVIAQAIIAATRDARDGHRLHSLHAYFLRPVRAGGEVMYTAGGWCGRGERSRRTNSAQNRVGSRFSR